MGTFIVWFFLSHNIRSKVLKGVLNSLKTTHRFNERIQIERILVFKYYRKFH